MTEHALFLEEIAVSQTPKRLGALIKVLEKKGQKPLGPRDRSGLHPLLVPVASDASGEEVTCLLRWPQPAQYKNMGMPVVSMRRGGAAVHLVARSVDEHLHRLLVEEDAEQAGPSGARPLADAAGLEASGLYMSGDMAAAGYPGKPQMYIIKKVGMFPDVCEALAQQHLSKGDKTSALVASEWYMRNGFFPGWGRPYEFAAELLTGLGRHEEARDMARVAMRLPWWTLRGKYEDVVKLAQLPGRTPEEVRYLLSEEAQAAAQAQQMRGVNFREPRTPQQVALDKANGLLDLVVAGARPSYDSVRGELAEAYREAGLADVANFIQASS